ncbi:hypothetical protein [Bdellovibrio reynosensis]|uniref:Uncharacterized protein n=1 Tax=Bdellovibrio reynosensis TaxID=2835041 RepID=A0ABY4CDS3_9BACT|nr:hypothetical protein [Bdellovibrio reynosensis]UOF01886.1 hypothetical protein MNR06_02820 [Bdellovibrio reynosensis]
MKALMFITISFLGVLVSMPSLAETLQCALWENVSGVDFKQSLILSQGQQRNIQTLTHTFEGAISYRRYHVLVKIREQGGSHHQYSIFNVSDKPKSFLLAQSKNGDSLKMNCAIQ